MRFASDLLVPTNRRISSNKCDVQCFGRNTDRLLFDRAGGGAYHSFIRGQAEIGKDIKLSAGLAHGIVPETKLAIFYSNIKDVRNEKLELLGEVVVKSASNTTSILRRISDGRGLPLPSIFYAVETHYPASEVGKTVRILIEGDPAGYPDPFSICGAKKADNADDANFTLTFNGERKPSLSWNGATGDRKVDSLPDSCPVSFAEYLFDQETDSQRFVRMLRKATRFAYHLLRVSPADSSFSPSLHLRLRDIGGSETTNTDGGGPKGDLLEASYVELKMEEDETRGPFLVDIVNKSEHNLWLHVFLFDPSMLNMCKSRPSIRDTER